MKLTYKQAKQNGTRYVYSTDDYGGIRRIILNWKSDEILDRGDVIPEYATIEDFFEEYGCPLFDSLIGAAKHFSLEGSDDIPGCYKEWYPKMKIPDGYRLLTEGQMTREGDQFWGSNDKWRKLKPPFVPWTCSFRPMIRLKNKKS